MKTFKLLTALLLGLMVTFSACKETPTTPVDPTVDPSTELTAPIYQTDFTITVDGNSVTFNCTKTGVTSYLWIVSTGNQYTTNPATIEIPVAGEYTVKLGISNGGDMVYSAQTPFTVESSNLDFLDEGIWKDLTGGSAGPKTWILDVNPETKKAVYFHNPVDFYGDATVGGAEDNIWGPWGGTSLYDWGSTPEEGSITFDGPNNLTVTAVINAETFTGKFAMEVEDRDPAFLTLTSGESLWDNFLSSQYSYLANCEYAGLSPQTANLKFTGDGVRFPLDNNRIADENFVFDDLQDLMIMHCSDSALVIRVKRTYEGENEDGSLKESKCWLLYNYIVEGYDYPQNAVAAVEPINTEATAASITGTYTYANPPYDWISWASGEAMNNWADAEALLATGWATLNEGWENSVFTFNADGSCNINGTETTYTVEAGVITFADSVSFAPGTVAINSTTINVLNVSNSTTGLWLGSQNAEKEESNAVHLQLASGYRACLSLADAVNWAYQYWGGETDIFVDADGTYSISAYGTMASTTGIVFVIDIKEAAAAFADGYAITVDSIVLDGTTEVTFDPSKVVVGDIEGNGNIRVEILNAWGATNSDPGLNAADIAFNESVEVTFTLTGSGL